MTGFDALYPPEKLDEILVHGPQIWNEEAKRHLRVRIYDIGLELYANRTMSDRPSVPEKQAALKNIAAQATSTLSGLKEIDHDARQALAMAYGSDGDTFLEDLRRNLHRVIRMSRYASRLIGPAPRGRPYNAALRSAIEDLLCAWLGVTGVDPKWTPFFEFVKLALTPIVGDLDFEGPCREIIYGEKAGKLRPR